MTPKRTLENLAVKIYSINECNGFWDDREDRNVGEMIALIHSELSEALEAHRKDLPDDHLPYYKGLEVELADAMIRILDMAVGLELNVIEALFDKVEYNKSRPYKHGKKY